MQLVYSEHFAKIGGVPAFPPAVCSERAASLRREVRIRVLLQARQMGCGASKPHTTVHLPPESSLRRTITPDPQSLAHGPQPTIRTAAEVLTIRLLDGLAAREEHVSLPVQSHAQRLGSAQRGWSRAAFRGLRAFYSKHGMLDKLMADLCKQEAAEHEASSRLSWSTSPRRPPAPVMSMCQLTKSTGLSLAESLVLAADGTEIATQVIGKATSFLSYSRTGTRLRDMFDAIERLLTKLEAQDGRTRYVWVRRLRHHEPPTRPSAIPSRPLHPATAATTLLPPRLSPLRTAGRPLLRLAKPARRCVPRRGRHQGFGPGGLPRARGGHQSHPMSGSSP